MQFSNALKIHDFQCDIVIIMITIQELHTYNNFVDMEIAPPFLCKIDEDHGRMYTWVNENDVPCFWCLGCNSKYYPSLAEIEMIKNLLRQ